MMNRWLILASLALTLNAATAMADDGWRPAGSAPANAGSNSSTAAFGCAGVSLGRPVGADTLADASVDKALADSNFTRASYQTPASLPSVVRSQSPEVPQPLPSGPATKSVNPTATPVSKSRSGFASGSPTLAEPPSGIFASDQPKSDAPLEAVPAPHPNLVPEPAGSECSSSLVCSPSDARACDCTCGDPCCEPNRLYVSGEYLLWWIKDSHFPPLVTTAPVGSTGVLGAPGTTVLFGGDVDNEERSGGRFTAGYWFDNCRTLALETTVFFLANRNVNFSADSNTFPVLARPFFSLNSGTEFSEVTTSPGLGTGNININTFSRMWGAELNLRYNVCDCCCWRFDLLGGFRYLSLREGLNIQENIVAAATAPVFARDTIQVNDDFNTRNQFYGGQLGYRLGWTRNRWSIDWLTKVALGDTHQVVNIQGNQLITTPAGATSFFNGGLLALGSNSGRFSRDQFTVVPETDLILGFRVTNHVRLLIGYSFLYWNNVARPGDQIDRVIDVSRIPNTGLQVTPAAQTRPVLQFKGSDFWAQGISFGLEFTW